MPALMEFYERSAPQSFVFIGYKMHEGGTQMLNQSLF